MITETIIRCISKVNGLDFDFMLTFRVAAVATGNQLAIIARQWLAQM